MDSKQRGENAMAGKSITCPNLEAHYNLPRQEKLSFIKTEAAVDLLNSLPENVSSILGDCFLSGQSLTENGGKEVIDYFRNNSNIVPDLSEYPGTYTMLEKMYEFEKVANPINKYFSKSLPGGVSLESRFRAVNEKAVAHIKEILNRQENCLVLDLGSGPVRNCISLSLENPDFASRVEFHCIDTDPAAIEFGKKLVANHNLHNIKFIEQSMARLDKFYSRNADYGLIIGVLCGLSPKERVHLLKIMRQYFKPGARVVGAGLLERMLQLDLLCAYILRETAGWILQYPPIGMIKKSFEDAGYTYEGYFQEKPTRCYEIGIGIV